MAIEGERQLWQHGLPGVQAWASGARGSGGHRVWSRLTLERRHADTARERATQIVEGGGGERHLADAAGPEAREHADAPRAKPLSELGDRLGTPDHGVAPAHARQERRPFVERVGPQLQIHHVKRLVLVSDGGGWPHGQRPGRRTANPLPAQTAPTPTTR